MYMRQSGLAAYDKLQTPYSWMFWPPPYDFADPARIVPPPQFYAPAASMGMGEMPAPAAARQDARQVRRDMRLDRRIDRLTGRESLPGFDQISPEALALHNARLALSGGRQDFIEGLSAYEMPAPAAARQDARQVRRDARLDRRVDRLGGRETWDPRMDFLAGRQDFIEGLSGCGCGGSCGGCGMSGILDGGNTGLIVGGGLLAAAAWILMRSRRRARRVRRIRRRLM